MSAIDHFEQRRRQGRRAARVYQVALWSGFVGSVALVLGIIFQG